MPIYEGIGVVGDKNAVVLDIGVAYTKCGFAGEYSPRCIIPTELYDWKTKVTTPVIDFKGTCVAGNFNVFVEFLHKIYYRHLLVNPKERRVVVVESVLCPTEFRETLAKVLFQHYEVPSVLFAPSHLVSCFPLGTQNVMVVDVGFSETLVLPVFEGVPMLNCWEASPVGAKAVQQRLQNLLTKDCRLTTTLGEVSVGEFPELLSNNVLEDITVRTAFVTPLDRGRAIQSEVPPSASPPEVEYPMDGDKVLHIKGSVRESVFEVLFEESEGDKSIPMLILDSLLRCPIDLRKPLAERILVTGGTCMAPGFMSRLKAELLDLLANHHRYKDKLPLKTVKFFSAPSKPNFTAWLGGSIFGSLEVLPIRSVSKEDYTENPKLPDWTQFSGTEAAADERPLR